MACRTVTWAPTRTDESSSVQVCRRLSLSNNRIASLSVCLSLLFADDCESEDGSTCSNGVCLDHQCHCNDGFGGCNCQVPGMLECVCSNCERFSNASLSLSLYLHCNCLQMRTNVNIDRVMSLRTVQIPWGRSVVRASPVTSATDCIAKVINLPVYGHVGQRLTLCFSLAHTHTDIDECQDPSIAARCVENAECCNLPAHFACKCKAGFEGDGEVHCSDIDECSRPGACGINADCINYPGNYTCSCRDGFRGNAYDGCVDIDECSELANACGQNAVCTNLEGGYLCHCPDGYEGDDAQHSGCVDSNECNRSPCGRNEECINDVGSYRCEQLKSNCF
jgi:hypothetical protein